MNEERKAKLEKLKQSKVAKDMVIISNGEPFLQVLEDKIVQLRKTLGVGVELTNLDDLLEQLNLLQSFQGEVKHLKDVIKNLDLPKEIEIKGIEDLIPAIKAIKAPKIQVQPTISTISGVARSAGNNPLIKGAVNITAFTITTSSTSPLVCTFQSSDGRELWRVLLQAPPDISTGANLAGSPYIFSGSGLVLNLNGSQTVHYSISYYPGS